MTHPALTRAHLEALVVARTLLDPALADLVNSDCLSPAAVALLDFAAEQNAAACASLLLGAEDEYQARLAKRVDALTLEALRFWPTATLVALVNALPPLGAKGGKEWAA